MSDTPETDKNLWDHGDEIDPSMRPDSHGNWVPEEFARKLERERGEANTKLQDVSSKLADALRERDEAQEVASGLAMQEERVNEAQKELSSIHQWIDRNHPDGFIDSQTYFQNLERFVDNWYDRLDRLEVDAKRFVRERDEARKHLRDANRGAEINAHINQKFAQQIIDAREKVKELIYIAERAIALAEIDFENDKFGVVSELRDGLERIKEGAK
jgi:hypothetical protein